MSSGGIAGAFESVFTGSNLGQKLKMLDKQGLNLYNSGRGFTEEGIRGLRDLDGRMVSQLDGGGLSAETKRSYDMAQGQLSDNFTRAGRSLRASLEQQRQAGGGFLSQDAIAEMTTEANQRNSEELFTSTNALASDRANLAQRTTMDLFERLTRIRDSIRETGLTEEQLGVMMRLQTASLQLQRNKAIDESARGWASMFMGGSIGG